MSGIVRQINGEIAQSKVKGKAFVEALNSAMSPSKIASSLPKTQVCKNTYKK